MKHIIFLLIYSIFISCNSYNNIKLIDFRLYTEEKLKVEWENISENTFNMLSLGDANDLVKEFFKRVPKESFSIDHVNFLNTQDLLDCNLKYVLTNVGFKFGYVCFATDPSGCPYVMDKNTGEILLVTREGVTQDYIIDLETYKEIPLIEKNFRKGIHSTDFYKDFDNFFTREIKSLSL